MISVISFEVQFQHPDTDLRHQPKSPEKVFLLLQQNQVIELQSHELVREIFQMDFRRT